VRELLDELGLRPLVVRSASTYQVGVGGARLPVADRQKVALVRALPQAAGAPRGGSGAAPLDPMSQQRVLDGILAERKGRGVAWVLSPPRSRGTFRCVW